MSKAITVMDGIIDRIHQELLDDFPTEELQLTTEIPADRTVH